MLQRIRSAYLYLFGRRRFLAFHKFLYRLSLRGMGILNHETPRQSGELAFLRQYLPGTKGAVFDVGANIGDYSRQVADIREGGQIFAFEPHPKTFQLLAENLHGFGNISLIQSGLSDTSGRLELYDYSEGDGSPHASLFKDVLTEIHLSNKVAKHDVAVTSVDEFVEEHGIDEISLLKIDTEGNELRVLQGATEAISNKMIKAIHFEFNEMNVVSRTFLRDFEKLLADYDIYRLLPNERYAVSGDRPIYREIFGYQNIVAILKD